MSFLLESAIRASIILVIAFVTLRLLGGRSAALRHSILAAAVGCAAMTPALSFVMPSWDIAIGYGRAAAVSREPIAESSAVEAAAMPVGFYDSPRDSSAAQTPLAEPAATAVPGHDSRRRQPQAGAAAGTGPQGRAETTAGPGATPPAAANKPWLVPLLTVIWTIGALFGLTVLVLHSRRLAFIASHATPVRKSKWSRFAAEICRSYGLRRRLRLLETSHPSVLATWGVLYPEVLFPASARDWSDERVRVVLSHELAHIRRCDWLIQVSAELLRAVYWFNPLFWLACNRLRQESEQACDDAVLNLGISNYEYAGHLLDLVRTLREPASSWALVSSMARPSTLERRFRALLNPRVKRNAMTRISILGIAALFTGITLPVAAFRASNSEAAEVEEVAGIKEAPAIPAVMAPAIAVPPLEPAGAGNAANLVGSRPDENARAPEAAPPAGPIETLRNAIATLFTPNTVQQPAAGAAATVEGIVVRIGGGEAIAGATVELQGVPPVPGTGGRGGPVAALSTATAADGRFVFHNVNPGDYRIAATRAAGYVLAEYGQRSLSGRGTIVTLSAGQKFPDLRLAMTPTGSISGRILDREGEPVARGQVQALQPAYRDGRKYFNIVQSIQTNDLGEYRLFWLAPGPYYISARAEDPQRRQAPIFVSIPGGGGTFEQASPPAITRRVLDNGEIVEDAFVLVYYPGATEAAAASHIDVRAGENLRAVDFAITAGQIRARHVRGRVIHAATGQPSRATIQAIPRTPSPNAAIASGNADQNGLFDISGVVPGAYYIYASGVGAPPPGSAAYGLAFVEVSAADVEDIAIVAGAGFNIPGRVTIEGRPAGRNDPDLMAIRVNLARDPNTLGLPPAGGIPTLPAGGGLPPSGAVIADGSFTLWNIGPGDYRVTVAAPPALYLKSIRLGGSDLLSSRLRMDRQPEGALEIVFGSTPGTLEGRVVSEKQEPAANVTVVLVPEPPHRPRLDMYKNIATDAAGRFRMQGIPPGDYKLFAWTEVERFAWQDAEFIRAHEGTGKPVRIEDGSKGTTELTVR